MPLGVGRLVVAALALANAVANAAERDNAGSAGSAAAPADGWLPDPFSDEVSPVTRVAYVTLLMLLGLVVYCAGAWLARKLCCEEPGYYQQTVRAPRPFAPRTHVHFSCFSRR